MKDTSAAGRALRVCAHVLTAAGLLMLLLLPADKYGWMADIDPTTPPASIADPAGNRLPFTLLVAGACVLLQGLAAWHARPRWQRLLSVAVMLATATLWWAKFAV